MPKIVEECTYPLTAPRCVDRIYTDLAVIDVTDDGLVVRELAPGVTFEYVQERTAAPLKNDVQPEALKGDMQAMTNATKKSTIDRSSSIPLYKQIKEILIEELQAARSETGRPFSTEHELVQRFHVSRAPVRQALKELADEGYVYRERAKGTFPVQELPVRPAGLELGGLVGFLREQGIDCNSKILVSIMCYPTEKLCSILGTEPDDKVLRILA